jgi:hypothetical protein
METMGTLLGAIPGEHAVLQDIYEEEAPEPPEGMTLGEQGTLAFIRTDSALLDFFFNVVPDSSKEEVEQLLNLAWAEDRHLTVGLIFQLGNARLDQGGKMDQENFHTSLLWLMREHPATLLMNLKAIPKHTYLKDLLMLVVSATELTSKSQSITGKRAAKEHRASIREKVIKRQRREGRQDRRMMFRRAFAATLNKPLEQIVVVEPEEVDEVMDEETVVVREEAADTTRDSEDKDSDCVMVSRIKNPKSNNTSQGRVARWVSEDVRIQWVEYWKARELAKTEDAKALGKRSRALALQERITGAEGDHQEFLDNMIVIVANIFAQGLTDEKEEFDKDPAKVSAQFCKWAPSLNGAHDKKTSLVDAIASLVFVKNIDGYLPTEGLPVEEALKARRINYRKLLSALRGASKVPEHYTGTGQWTEVDYNRMASRCRLIYGLKTFRKHDQERYDAFLKQAQIDALQKMENPEIKGKSVKVGALLPHEVTMSAFGAYMQLKMMEEDVQFSKAMRLGEIANGMHINDDCFQVDDADKDLLLAQQLQANLQWHGIVQTCKKAAEKGEGIGCWIPVCDVSGSMAGDPMEVAVALSLLLSELNSEASGWHGKMFTFHETPELVTVASEFQDATGGEEEGAARLHNIGRMVYETKNIGWGGNTNLDATMDLFLTHSIEARTTRDDMTRQCVVIFSDMEFSSAYSAETPWVTAHEKMNAEFIDAGYVEMPLIVYWNLRASSSVPIQKSKTPGVLLLSGFSAGLLRSFLAGKLDEFTPAAQLSSILSKPAYASLLVEM